MDTITGPQSTQTQREHLTAMAGALDYTVLTVAVLGIASHVHRLPGWIRCPTASADVIMASALGIPMTDIVMPALQPEPGHIRSAS